MNLSNKKIKARRNLYSEDYFLKKLNGLLVRM